MAKKYKIKAHSGAKKRIYVTGAGKLLRRKSHFNHFRRRKRPGGLRELHDKIPLSDGFSARLKKILPYTT
ncbi:MAG TPA: bL35 family ribosomal protein [Dehalococcoidia bacterium]|nr:bL35 family ribosomal protein [Dehalococcoidia bacterium]